MRRGLQRSKDIARACRYLRILLLPRRSSGQDGLVPAFVLTPEEKRALVFVLTAFLLGLATKYYRDTHPLATATQKVHYQSSSQTTNHPWAREVSRKQKRQDLGPD
jgi:hypothetical protein